MGKGYTIEPMQNDSLNTIGSALTYLINKMAHKLADWEDSAVYSYIKAQADYLTGIGEDLSEYALVSDYGNYAVEDKSESDGIRMVGKHMYHLVKRSEIKDICFPDD